jgi:hypothetical protein
MVRTFVHRKGLGSSRYWSIPCTIQFVVRAGGCSFVLVLFDRGELVSVGLSFVLHPGIAASKTPMAD